MGGLVDALNYLDELTPIGSYRENILYLSELCVWIVVTCVIIMQIETPFIILKKLCNNPDIKIFFFKNRYTHQIEIKLIIKILMIEKWNTILTKMKFSRFLYIYIYSQWVCKRDRARLEAKIDLDLTMTDKLLLSIQFLISPNADRCEKRRATMTTRPTKWSFKVMIWFTVSVLNWNTILSGVGQVERFLSLFLSLSVHGVLLSRACVY